MYRSTVLPTRMRVETVLDNMNHLACPEMWWRFSRLVEYYVEAKIL